VGPEHAFLRDQGRIEFDFATDDEALDAFQKLSQIEGIIPALETAHAIAYILKAAPTLPKDSLIIANLSGRGDKDVSQAAEILLR
jgi:tryptophan synthase beta chain